MSHLLSLITFVGSISLIILFDVIGVCAMGIPKKPKWSLVTIMIGLIFVTLGVLLYLGTHHYLHLS